MMCVRNGVIPFSTVNECEPRVVISTVGNLVRGKKITTLDWFLENTEFKLTLGGRIFRSAE